MGFGSNTYSEWGNVTLANGKCYSEEYMFIYLFRATKAQLITFSAPKGTAPERLFIFALLVHQEKIMRSCNGLLTICGKAALVGKMCPVIWQTQGQPNLKC
jgi:hypothetical protein